MTRLEKYLKLHPYIITIKYGKETIRFNLAEELKVSEISLNSDLKKQPSKYGFALLVVGKLKTRFEELKTQRRQIRGRLYRRAKGMKLETTGRLMSDDHAKAWVESHPKFVRISRQCIRAKDAVDQMYAVVRAFEQRSNLIQTISSNIRNEKGN
jgi:hypothetical protein